MTTGEADLLTSILQGVVTQGTGKRAALPDRPVAGKTGTTDNYGDAWFVGYTPQLAVAVWVGYPDKLQPMLTRVRRQAGRRRHPAGADLARVHDGCRQAARRRRPEQFPPTPYIPAQDKRIVWRGGSYKLDNGYCPGTRVVAYFAGRGPSTPGQVLRERGLGPARRRQDGRHRQRDARAAAARQRADRRSDQGRQASRATSSSRSRATGTCRPTTRCGSTSPGRTRATGCSRTSSGRASPRRARG